MPRVSNHPQLPMLRRTIIRLLAGLAALSFIFLIYLPGTTGALYYDDYNALNRMGAIESFDDAKSFVLGGTAGPLGRPIALLSYLPHADRWPDSSTGILRDNTIIHAFNALLLGILAFLILRLRPEPENAYPVFWIALGAALLWAVMPINASASLIAIQRMTTLAATFGLLGLIGFVAGYHVQRNHPVGGLFVQFGALGLGTLLAVFTKESGALVPVYALVIDAVLLRHLPLPNPWRNIRRGSLWLAFLAVFAFVAWSGRDLFTVNDFRGFSSWERLQTEAVIVWEYLRLTLMPLPTAFGPFHDHRAGNEFTGLSALLAALGWLALLMTALWVHRRWRNPWPLYALLWFFTGHLLESTTILLEPYFEHRNYLATFGLCLMLAVAAGHAPGQLRRVAPLLFGLVILLNAAILYSMTSLWGKPLEAAQMWAERNPGSARAALHSVFVEFGAPNRTTADLNDEMIVFERRRFALTVLDRTARVCPECLDVRMQALLHACLVEAPDDVRGRFDALLAMSNSASINISVADGVFALDQLIEREACPPLTGGDATDLVDRIITGSHYLAPALHARLLFVSAKIADAAGDMAEAESRLHSAEGVAPTAMPVLQFQVYLYNKLGRFSDALAAVARRRSMDRSGTAMSDAALDELTSLIKSTRNDSTAE